MNVSVFGLGYVGSVSAASFAAEANSSGPGADRHRSWRVTCSFVKNSLSDQLPSKTVPGAAISAKVGTLSETRLGSTEPRGAVRHPNSRDLPRSSSTAVRSR